MDIHFISTRFLLYRFGRIFANVFAARCVECFHAGATDNRAGWIDIFHVETSPLLLDLPESLAAETENSTCLGHGYKIIIILHIFPFLLDISLSLYRYIIHIVKCKIIVKYLNICIIVLFGD